METVIAGTLGNDMSTVPSSASLCIPIAGAGTTPTRIGIVGASTKDAGIGTVVFG
jgi:hypothetical protein